MNGIGRDWASDIRSFKFTPCKPGFLNSGGILESLEEVSQTLMSRLHPRPWQRDFLGLQNKHQHFLNLLRWT